MVRNLACFLFFVPFLPSPMAQAQSQTLDKQTPMVRVEDGGTREVLESIVIPPMPNAPFTITLQTEWARSLADGGTITLVNERRIARDSSGRIYQERWLLVPKNGDRKSKMNAIQISDPNRHTLYTCILDNRHVCTLITYKPTTSTVYKMEGQPSGPLANNAGFTTHEELGNQLVQGVDTAGGRDSTTFNPGVFGNDRHFTVAREYWYSSQLGINLVSTRSDPRFGTQTFTVSSLSRAEPDPQLFELPEGFKVVDQQVTTPPATD